MPCLELRDRLEIPSLTGLPYVPSVKASCLHFGPEQGHRGTYGYYVRAGIIHELYEGPQAANYC